MIAGWDSKQPDQRCSSEPHGSLLPMTESLPLLKESGVQAVSNWRRSLLDDLWRRLEVVTVCVAYAVFGPAVIVVNNHIVKDLNFPYPMLLSAIGLFTTACFCTVVMCAFPEMATSGSTAPIPVRLDRSGSIVSDDSNVNVSSHQGDVSMTIKPGERWRPTWSFWLRNMAPIGLAQGLTFACGNAAYMYLTITFTQMLSAFTPTPCHLCAVHCILQLPCYLSRKTWVEMCPREQQVARLAQWL
eukprot:scaffold40984_cov36-Tisochrysis_lutea.AAC.1